MASRLAYGSLSFLLVLSSYEGVKAGLNIVPKGVVTICANSKQVFNCTYGDNDSFHRFLLNSTDASVYHNDGVHFTDMSDAHMMMLRVPAVPEFNNTNVSCKSQSDQSGPTLLIIQGPQLCGTAAGGEANTTMNYPDSASISNQCTASTQGNTSVVSPTMHVETTVTAGHCDVGCVAGVIIGSIAFIIIVIGIVVVSITWRKWAPHVKRGLLYRGEVVVPINGGEPSDWGSSGPAEDIPQQAVDTMPPRSCQRDVEDTDSSNPVVHKPVAVSNALAEGNLLEHHSSVVLQKADEKEGKGHQSIPTMNNCNDAAGRSAVQGDVYQSGNDLKPRNANLAVPEAENQAPAFTSTPGQESTSQKNPNKDPLCQYVGSGRFDLASENTSNVAIEKSANCEELSYRDVVAVSHKADSSSVFTVGSEATVSSL